MLSVLAVAGGVAEWLKAAVLKTVGCHSPVGSNPTSSATKLYGEMAESAEGARLLSVYASKAHRGFESLSLRHF